MENVGKKFGGNILPSGKGKVFDLARRLRRAQQIAQIGYWELSLVDDQHFWSEEIIELLGSKKNGKKFDEKFFFRHIHHADTEKLKQALRAASQNSDELQVVQFRIIKDDTREISNVEAKFIGAVENGSGIVRIEGTLQNVDERVMAIDALAESKIRLQKAFEVANTGSYKYNIQTDILEWSKEAEGVANFEDDRIPKTFKEFIDLIHPDDVPKLLEGANKTNYINTFSYEYRLKGKKGYRWIHSHLQRFYNDQNESDYVIGVIRDITEEKEETIKKEATTQQLHTGAELAQLGFWEFDYSNHKFTFNDQFYNVFKTSKEEMGGYELTVEEYINRFYVPDEDDLSSEEVIKLLKTPDTSPIKSFEHSVKFGNGVIGYVVVKSAPVFDKKGKLIKRIGANQDITQKVEEEKAKELVAQQLKSGAELAQLAYWEYDFSTNSYLFNDQFYKVLKTSVDHIGSYSLSTEEYMNRFFPKDKEGIELKESMIELMSEKKMLDVKEIEHKIIMGDGTEGYVAVRSTPVENARGELVRIIGAIQDITHRVIEEEKKEQVAQQLQSGAELAKMGYWEYDYRRQLFLFNDQFYNVFRTNAQTMGGYEVTAEEYIDRFYYFEDSSPTREEIIASMKSFQTEPRRRFKHKVQFGDGQVGTIAVNSMLISDSSGNIVRRIGANIDITQEEDGKEQLEAALKNLEENYYQLKISAELARVGYWSLDVSTGEFTFNDQFYQVYKTSVKEIGGYTMNISEYMKEFDIEDDVEQIAEMFQAKFIDGYNEPLRFFHSLRFGNGDIGYVAVLALPVYDENGVLVKLIGANQDVTDQEKRKQLLEKALEEKVTLLSEVHHRVKNNLALISGLLQLQTMYSDFPPLNSKLQQSTTRIKSIALVHELLYQSAHLTSINLKEYLTKVIPTLEATYAPIGIDITINIEADDHEININQAVPVGLLLNELITNSFQYAFNNKARGTIDIHLTTSGDIVKMSYSDNGIGIADFTDIERATSLGFTLIKSQLDQLSAEYNLDTTEGFKLEFSFIESDRGSHSNV